MGLKMLCTLMLVLGLALASGETTSLDRAEVRRMQRDNNQQHGALLKELDETTSPSRKKVLEEDIKILQHKKKMLKFMAKGHSEANAAKIVQLERRLHGLQDQRGTHRAQSREEQADVRLEMKAMRAELNKLKFPTAEERMARGASEEKKTAKNVKELRASAKTLRAQIRSATDPAEKQRLRDELDRLYE
eukprot:INCI13636.1.p1 GENE.INCI13636.1~~INCI13636.1.p1  ORF type:complete len:190 (+),score=43.05 INCI13636.1:129-698(+)